MKKTTAALTVLGCLAFLPAILSAQPTETEQRKQQAMAKMMPHAMKMMFRTFGEGKSLGMSFVQDGDDKAFQQLIGTTDEQYYSFDAFMLGVKETFKPHLDELMENAIAAETPEDMADLEAEVNLVYGKIFELVDGELRETLTPAQLANLQAFELQTFADAGNEGFPMINYDAYNTLGLDERQKEELEEIRKEFDKEQSEFFDEMSKLLPKSGQPPKPEEMQALHKKLQEHSKKGKALMARIKAKIVSILNKEQEKKLNDLLTNIPDYIKEKKKKRGLPPKPVDEEAYGKWRESWKPGQPVPPEFREREKSKRKIFPMSK